MDKLTEGQTMMNSERKNYLKDQVTDNERINSVPLFINLAQKKLWSQSQISWKNWRSDSHGKDERTRWN